jgi:hypothetical protein
VAGAGIWCACHARGLDVSLSLTFIAGCIGGMLYQIYGARGISCDKCRWF